MPLGFVIVVMGLAALWFLAHRMVKRRMQDLKATLPDAYQSTPSDGSATPQLMALCVDLIRKEHCNLPFEALSPHEQRMVLHARALDVLPRWMSRYANFCLAPANRRLINKLRDVQTSRPDRQKQHFGAIKRQLQLRSSPES